MDSVRHGSGTGVFRLPGIRYDHGVRGLRAGRCRHRLSESACRFARIPPQWPWQRAGPAYSHTCRENGRQDGEHWHHCRARALETLVPGARVRGCRHEAIRPFAVYGGVYALCRPTLRIDERQSDERERDISVGCPGLRESLQRPANVGQGPDRRSRP
ncbi:hypothetical protein DESC_180091 [Desulfosarcina cetonica]|nr:hypothetical protein DESC_180091 [Desulfosarcina cetonica]